MNHPDLNDLQFYAMVVEHGGFAAAERALGVPKIAAEPAHRPARNRTRRAAVAAERRASSPSPTSAKAFIATRRRCSPRRRPRAKRWIASAPRRAAVIKVSCPVAIAQEDARARSCRNFMKKHPPGARVQLHVSNRRVDVIQGRFRHRDPRAQPARPTTARWWRAVSASCANCWSRAPKYLDRVGRPAGTNRTVGKHTTLSMSEDDSRQRWTLHGPDGQVSEGGPDSRR